MERLEYKAELRWDGNVGSEAKVRDLRKLPLFQKFFESSNPLKKRKEYS